MERSKFARKGEAAAKASSASNRARDSLCRTAPALAPMTLRWPKLRFQRVLRGAVSGAPARALSAVRIKRCREYSATRRISLPRRQGRSHGREPGARPLHRVLRQAASGQDTQQTLTALQDKIAPSVFPPFCRLSRRNSTAPPNGYTLSQYNHRDRISSPRGQCRIP